MLEKVIKVRKLEIYSFIYDGTTLTVFPQQKKENLDPKFCWITKDEKPDIYLSVESDTLSFFPVTTGPRLDTSKDNLCWFVVVVEAAGQIGHNQGCYAPLLQLFLIVYCADTARNGKVDPASM